MLSECKVRQQLSLTVERDSTHSDPLNGGAEAVRRDEAGPVLSGKDSTKAACGGAGSPRATRLCPNARVFVPSVRKEPSMGGPPGLESYSSTVGLSGKSPASTKQHTAGAEVVDAMPRLGTGASEIVDPARRALFP